MSSALMSLVKSSISVTTQEFFSEMKTRQYPKLEPEEGGDRLLGLIFAGYVPLAS